MEDSLRTALMIISAIALLAILAHGLWKIRKNRNPYKLKTQKEAVDPIKPTVDSSGFDQYGVGAVRVVKPSALTGEIDNPPRDEQIPKQPAPAPDYNEEPIPSDLKQVTNMMEDNLLSDEVDIGIDYSEEHLHIDVNNQFDEELAQLEQGVFAASEYPEDVVETSQKVTTEKVKVKNSNLEQTVYQTPVTNQKPFIENPYSRRTAKAQEPRKRVATSKASSKQISMNFGDDLFAEEEPTSKTKVAPEKKEIAPEIIVLSVIAPEDNPILGAALLPLLLTLGMRYGEMNIFHRHEDNAGNGKVTFSLANIMNPGTFDLDNMENFVTKGVSLFMTLPNAGDAFVVFDQMLHAAKQIAHEFHGQVIDDKRSVMTKQTEQHYVSKIREFDRKYRIAMS